MNLRSAKRERRDDMAGAWGTVALILIVYMGS